MKIDRMIGILSILLQQEKVTAPYDMQEILAGLRSLDSVSGTKHFAQLMEKLSAGSSALIPGGQNILIDLSSWYKDSLAPKIAEIRKAMDHCRLLCFRYFAPKGETRRCIEPYYLIFQWASWYVWGYCQDRKDYRLFKLNRMENLEIKEEFQKRSVPLPDLRKARTVGPGRNSVRTALPGCPYPIISRPAKKHAGKKSVSVGIP